VLEYKEDISDGEDEYEEDMKLFFEFTSDHECGLLQYEEMFENATQSTNLKANLKEKSEEKQ
jgi:hypothetical protein